MKFEKDWKSTLLVYLVMHLEKLRKKKGILLLKRSTRLGTLRMHQNVYGTPNNFEITKERQRINFGKTAQVHDLVHNWD